ncbi:MAG: sugar ABC transporter ATP-binding protein [Pseudomonadota bacterium]
MPYPAQNQTNDVRRRPSVVRLEGISKAFGGVQALRDVDFEVAEGEVCCLAGENGSGKSTLIKIITGVYKPDGSAMIEFAGRRIASLTPVNARQLGVQVIWQDLSLFPHLTVAENIAFERNLGGWPRWTGRRGFRQVARAVLDRLGLRLDLDAAVKDLPIAQRQVVAICRALAAEPKIVFMDEPTASLTKAETDALLDVVRRLANDGISVVFVSHRLAEVLEISERVTVLRDGRKVGDFPSHDMTQTRLTELMTGATFDDHPHASDRSAAPVVLETKSLTRYGEYRDVSITVRQGEIVGLTGLLGAGRTELASTLFGMTRPDNGKILLNGEPGVFASNREAIEAGIGYVPEDRLSLGLVQPQTIADNIVAPVLKDVLGPAGLVDSRLKSSLVDGWIERLSIKVGRPEDAVNMLSGGNQQRVVLAKWLATNPKLMILDAPTVGVDVGARAAIFEIVRSLAEAGMAILLISDEIPEVYFNADRVLHMRDGQIVDEYVPEKTSMDEIEMAVHA